MDNQDFNIPLKEFVPSADLDPFTNMLNEEDSKVKTIHQIENNKLKTNQTTTRQLTQNYFNQTISKNQ